MGSSEAGILDTQPSDVHIKHAILKTHLASLEVLTECDDGDGGFGGVGGGFIGVGQGSYSVSGGGMAKRMNFNGGLDGGGGVNGGLNGGNVNGSGLGGEEGLMESLRRSVMEEVKREERYARLQDSSKDDFPTTHTTNHATNHTSNHPTTHTTNHPTIHTNNHSAIPSDNVLKKSKDLEKGEREYGGSQDEGGDFWRASKEGGVAASNKKKQQAVATVGSNKRTSLSYNINFNNYDTTIGAMERLEEDGRGKDSREDGGSGELGGLGGVGRLDGLGGLGGLGESSELRNGDEYSMSEMVDGGVDGGVDGDGKFGEAAGSKHDGKSDFIEGDSRGEVHNGGDRDDDGDDFCNYGENKIIGNKGLRNDGNYSRGSDHGGGVVCKGGGGGDGEDGVSGEGGGKDKPNEMESYMRLMSSVSRDNVSVEDDDDDDDAESSSDSNIGDTSEGKEGGGGGGGDGSAPEENTADDKSW